jgi:hypothetical protein
VGLLGFKTFEFCEIECFVIEELNTDFMSLVVGSVLIFQFCVIFELID